MEDIQASIQGIALTQVDNNPPESSKNSQVLPKENLPLERYTFFTMRQRSDQTIDQFIMDLKMQSKKCKLENLNDDLIQTMIICGVRSGEIRAKLLKEDGKTLEETIERCKILEKSVSKGQNEEMTSHNPVESVEAVIQNCSYCGQRPRGSSTLNTWQQREHQVMTSECTFFINNQPLTASRTLLAKQSPVFEKMLYGEMAEDNITITDIEAVEFAEMLKFVAGQQIEISSIAQAWSLFYVAHKYLMTDFGEACQSYIKRNLTLSNILLCYEYAEMYGVEKLRLHILNDIGVYVKGVFEIGCADYHMKPSTLLAILERKSLQIVNSDLVDYILQWAMNECELRDISISSLSISQLLNDLGITQVLEIEGSCFENNQFVYLIAKKYHKKHWCTFCKSRTNYKIAGRTKFLDSSDELISNVSSNKDVALFGIVVLTEDKPAQETKNDRYFGKISITICELDNPDNYKVFTYQNTLCYETDTYVPFNEIFVMESFKNYLVKVEYKNFDTAKEGYMIDSSILRHYMNRELEDEKRDVKIVFDEMYGSVIRAICYYRI